MDSIATYQIQQHIIYQLLKLVQSANEPQHEKTYRLTCASNENSNQPALPRSLIRVFVVRMKTVCILSYPKCVYWRFWSDCANAQDDLNVRSAHMSKGTFFDAEAEILIVSNVNDHLAIPSTWVRLAYLWRYGWCHRSVTIATRRYKTGFLQLFGRMKAFVDIPM